jgi:hypothetical protein
MWSWLSHFNLLYLSFSILQNGILLLVSKSELGPAWLSSPGDSAAPQVRPSTLSVNKPSRQRWCTLKFEDSCEPPPLRKDELPEAWANAIENQDSKVFLVSEVTPGWGVCDSKGLPEFVCCCLHFCSNLILCAIGNRIWMQGSYVKHLPAVTSGLLV